MSDAAVRFMDAFNNPEFVLLAVFISGFIIGWGHCIFTAVVEDLYRLIESWHRIRKNKIDRT